MHLFIRGLREDKKETQIRHLKIVTNCENIHTQILKLYREGYHPNF